MGAIMVVRKDTVVMYRDLARRWSERAQRSPSGGGREHCEQLAEAYRSLVNTLDAELKLQDRAG